MIKSDFYKIFGAGFKSSCIGSERNPKEHRRMKTSLSAAFSTKTLSEQEHLATTLIDQFIQKIESDGKSSVGLDITKWTEMLAFDLMGEMTFGESFHCVETGT